MLESGEEDEVGAEVRCWEGGGLGGGFFGGAEWGRRMFRKNCGQCYNKGYEIATS